MDLMCLKNARVAEGIPEVSRYGCESHHKDFKSKGDFGMCFKQRSDVL